MIVDLNCIHHTTYGPGVPEHSSGNQINALVKSVFATPLRYNNAFTNRAKRHFFAENI